MTEKRTRRTQEEVEQLVAKVKQMVANGTPATKACEQLGLQYQSYQRHSGSTGAAGKSSAKGTSGQVQKLLSQLVDAIRREVRQEIKASL